MRDETFSLEPTAAAAQPPFSSDYVPLRRKPFWIVRSNCGRRVGRAATRLGARAAIRALYATAAIAIAGCSVGYVDRPLPDGAKLVRTCIEGKIFVAQDGSYWLMDDRTVSKNVLTPIMPGALLNDICV